MANDTHGVVNIVSKSQLPSSNGLVIMFFEDSEEKDDLINNSITYLFDE